MVKEKTIIFVCLCFFHLVGKSQTFVNALVVSKDQSIKIRWSCLPRYCITM